MGEIRWPWRRRAEPVPSPADAASRVVILVRERCGLCVEAAAVADEVCGAEGIRWETQDVDADATLRRAYTDHVPVTFVDGERLSYWGLDPQELRAALDRPRTHRTR